MLGEEDLNRFQSARYVYGIMHGADQNFNTFGIEGNQVYLIQYRDIGALVHACLPQPYQSGDRKQVENWLRQHQNVVAEALCHTDSLIPMSFDVIINGTSASNPDDVLRQWLQDRYNSIKDLLKQLSGREEFGIKIYGSPEELTAKVTEENPEVIELSNRIASMSKGTAFLYKSELSQKIRKAINEECGGLATEIIHEIRQRVVDIKENKPDSAVSGDNLKPILNLAVLAEPDKVESIGELLESYQNKRHLTVIFTGPWPAYSFVKDLN
jgi:hypothetical protein